MFSKVKSNEKGVELHWTTTENDNTIEHSLSGKERPLPPFTAALQAFKGYVMELLALPEEWRESLTITSLSIDEDGDGRTGLIVTAIRKIERASGLAELEAGDAGKAETIASDALALARRSFVPGNFRLGASLYALARAKLANGMADASLKLLDEALSVGDRGFREKVKARLQDYHRQGGTLVLVSHDPNELRAICTRAIWLRQGRLVDDGGVGRVLDAYRETSEAR